MKKLVSAIAVITILAVGVVAFAHGPGAGKGYGDRMMGPGYGGHMMGPGYGGHMMGRAGTDDPEVEKFLNETAGLRKELHDKKFNYREARRNPKTTVEMLKGFEKEILDLKWKIREKAPEKDFGRAGGYGCW